MVSFLLHPWSLLQELMVSFLLHPWRLLQELMVSFLLARRLLQELMISFLLHPRRLLRELMAVAHGAVVSLLGLSHAPGGESHMPHLPPRKGGEWCWRTPSAQLHGAGVTSGGFLAGLHEVVVLMALCGRDEGTDEEKWLQQ
ncbi:hypothetical protein TREES_T100015617 [Tupaia chinensis]|uniref:Uncharacterized protein n=1 Tax=Tupaia chinensis TaxID=246437 RepID=L9LBR2_TUPCH|nr:hypothetical protein TREES_T100015617 [Tupaia chinensis]